MLVENVKQKMIEAPDERHFYIEARKYSKPRFSGLFFDSSDDLKSSDECV